MKTFRTGIIGCGHFARQHAERLAALESDVQLVGFCDKMVERAIAYNHEFGQGKGQVYADYEQISDELDLERIGQLHLFYRSCFSSSLGVH
jgi:predicted dehydrogenase